MHFRQFWGIVVSLSATVFSLYHYWVPMNYAPIQRLRESLNRLSFETNQIIYLVRNFDLDSYPVKTLVGVRRDFWDYFQKQKISLREVTVAEFEAEYIPKQMLQKVNQLTGIHMLVSTLVSKNDLQKLKTLISTQEIRTLTQYVTRNLPGRMEIFFTLRKSSVFYGSSLELAQTENVLRAKRLVRRIRDEDSGFLHSYKALYHYVQSRGDKKGPLFLDRKTRFLKQASKMQKEYKVLPPLKKFITDVKDDSLGAPEKLCQLMETGQQSWGLHSAMLRKMASAFYQGKSCSEALEYLGIFKRQIMYMQKFRSGYTDTQVVETNVGVQAVLKALAVINKDPKKLAFTDTEKLMTWLDRKLYQLAYVEPKSWWQFWRKPVIVHIPAFPHAVLEKINRTYTESYVDIPDTQFVCQPQSTTFNRLL